MQVYLVGGAVRDQLLGRAPHERDWVVVGGSPEEMQRLGYRPVGRDFPVYLHPKTGEEYALARQERKVGPGYRGFVTEFSPAVTLEQDLARRDLTINAMALAADGTLVDPFGGRADLEQRRLRHVSPAFGEDPVRILRVARFLARFAPLGFAIAPETLALMRQMVRSGEAAALVPERVWRELERALGEPAPEQFFAALADCGALGVVLPELAPLWSGVPPTGDGPALAGAAALRAAVDCGGGPEERLAALLAGIGAAAIERLCARVRAPHGYRELAVLAARLAERLRAAGADLAVRAADPGWVLELLESADAFRRPERFRQWLVVLVARARAAGVPPPAAAALAERLAAAATRAGAVRLGQEDVAGRPGTEVAARLRALRRAAIAAA